MSAAAPAPERAPKGTPLGAAAAPARLSVLSYNLLAPLYVRPIDARTGGVQAFAAFEWCGPGDELLDFAARCPRMLAEVRAAAADAVMLQEVQFEPNDAGDGFALPAWLRPLTVEGGGDYIARIPAQGDLKEIAERNLRVLNCLAPVGNALLLRQGRLEPLEVAARVAPGTKSAAKGATTRVGALVKGAQGSGLESLGPTALFSVHLDATHEDQRVATIAKCMTQARQLGTREVLVAGDMNTEILPGSCVAALLDLPGAADEWVRECASALRLGDELPNAEQLEAWQALRETAAVAARETRVALRRVETHGTRAAYDHGQSVGPCRSWRLDHILYTARTLQPAVVWETLEADLESTASGLPNETCPSDHVPVGASFEVRPVPRLGEAEAEALRASWEGRARAQSLEVAALEAELALDEQAIAAALNAAKLAAGDADEGAATAEAAAASAADQPPNGKKSKKAKKGGGKAKPSPEMIAFLRSKRERLKALRAAHAEVVAGGLGRLGELELDVVEGFGAT